jgi:cytochrome c
MRTPSTIAVPAIHLAMTTLLSLGASLCAWLLLFLVFPVFGAPPGVSAASGNADNGKLLFEKRCGGCHSLDQDKEGPRLRDVFERKAGSIRAFKYSDSVKASTVVWNEATLDKWLTDTESVIPDNDMTFRVPNAAERADIIQYLRVSSSQ